MECITGEISGMSLCDFGIQELANFGIVLKAHKLLAASLITRGS
jgi:hypothetical protein